MGDPIDCPRDELLPSVFIAVTLGFALIVAALLVNRARPSAESHYRQQYSVVHEYEMSAHAQKLVSCFECHQPQANEERKEHHGFTISTKLTAANCRSCHESIYQEFLRSRHAAVSWAAVYGKQGLSPEQANLAEQYHPGDAKRPPHPFTTLEGPQAMTSGCEQCHAIGRPNQDGSIGTCTACHTRHTSSVAIAREPRTCGQCHMGSMRSRSTASCSTRSRRCSIYRNRLALGGFFGNFVLSVTEHAENGFFHWTEWIPVASSAFAVAFLILLFFVRPTRRYLAACALVLAVEATVGVVGFTLHFRADLEGPSRSLYRGGSGGDAADCVVRNSR